MKKAEYKLSKIETTSDLIKVVSSIKYNEERKRFIKAYAKLNPQLSRQYIIDEIMTGIGSFVKSDNKRDRLVGKYNFLWLPGGY
jgi:hypothetical protein